MNIQRATPFNETLAKIIFLILPTALVGYFLIWNANEYYGVIGDPHSGLFSSLPAVANQTLQLTLFAALGMVLSAVFYSFRFRFLLPFLGLLFLFWAFSKGLDSFASGEFDAFFIAVQFKVFTILFVAGWLIGYGFLRLRYFSVFISAALLCACIYLIAKANADTVYGLLQAFLPALLYSVYIIFTSEQIYNYKDKSQKFWWFLSRRLVGFALVAALLLGGVVYLLKGEIEETVANYGGGGKQGENSMLKQNKDKKFDLKDHAKLRGSLGRNNELLFCAHIDNYFPNTDIPNPLYLTAFYYTKFDTLTETFERDSIIPSNDLFEPDPSALPLFATRTDSSVIKNSLGKELRRSIDIEVYSAKLSASTYLAPNVGYFVQPITVEKDFRDQFQTAFRAKSYISELNSAYFVYNSPDPQVKKFQEQRFEVLRTVKGYTGTDKKFMDYYTYMPGDAKFRAIGELATKVTANAKTPVDKILAIRDYFLSKDEGGQPLYKYTDNPGVPDIPSASKLQYFLFENHQGYCAYFAGATLFMLRALGIPSRITVGFMTVDRSDKNKGWYWYYADQAHAWVQVYFPGYGWIDFDTTVGNSDAQESPAPDGTPPMQPPKAWLAADGIIQEIDTIKKLLKMDMNRMVFHDVEYKLGKSIPVTLDVKVASIRKDSVDVPLSTVQKGEEATAVSYAEVLRNMKVAGGEKAEAIVGRFPKAIPTDEVYLKRKDIAKPEEKKQEQKKEDKLTAQEVLWTVIAITGGFLLLILLMPSLVMLYYRLRFRNAKPEGSKPYWAYRAATYYLHMVGLTRGNLTPMQYAREVADPAIGGNRLASYMNIYLKKKYAKQDLNAGEQERVSAFLPEFLKAAGKAMPFSKKFFGFLNPVRAVNYFVTPEDKEN